MPIPRYQTSDKQLRNEKESTSASQLRFLSDPTFNKRLTLSLKPNEYKDCRMETINSLHNLDFTTLTPCLKVPKSDKLDFNKDSSLKSFRKAMYAEVKKSHLEPSCASSSCNEDSEEEDVDDTKFKVEEQSKPKKAHTPFPQVLFEILSKAEYSSIISWLPHGKAFAVYDKKKFVDIVSPSYFKETKFESFTRKLNRWGFIRISKGPDVGSFYHQFFLRDDVPQSSKIRCQKKYERKKPVNTNFDPTTLHSLSPMTIDEKSVASQENIDLKRLESQQFYPQLPFDSQIKQDEQNKNLLNYIKLKQQYEHWLQQEVLMKAKLKSQPKQQKKMFGPFVDDNSRSAIYSKLSDTSNSTLFSNQSTAFLVPQGEFSYESKAMLLANDIEISKSSAHSTISSIEKASPCAKPSYAKSYSSDMDESICSSDKANILSATQALDTSTSVNDNETSSYNRAPKKKLMNRRIYRESYAGNQMSDSEAEPRIRRRASAA